MQNIEDLSNDQVKAYFNPESPAFNDIYCKINDDYIHKECYEHNKKKLDIELLLSNENLYNNCLYCNEQLIETIRDSEGTQNLLLNKSIKIDDIYYIKDNIYYHKKCYYEFEKKRKNTGRPQL
jgi:hypothetical protein